MRYIVSIILWVAIAATASAQSTVNSIKLRATPDTIRADGLSKASIIAEVRDRSGQLVGDGTEIRFSTTLGNFNGDTAVTVLTAAGTARVTLTSSTSVGTALVTATAGQANQEIRVNFGTQTIADRGPQYLNLTADWMAFATDYRVVDAIGKVRARWRYIEIRADSLQINVDQNIIRAQNHVKVTSGSKSLEGSMLYFSLLDSRGILLSAEEGKRFFQGEALTPLDPESQFTPEGAFVFEDTSGSGMLIRSRGLILYPNEKIQFRSSTLYVSGGKVVNMPYQVISLTGYGDDMDQYLGYGTNGLTLDLPFYYSMTADGSGALRVRFQEKAGWLGRNSRKGWSLDLEQKYGYKSSGEGTVNVDHIASRDWGLHWDHSARISPESRGYFYMDYFNHQNLYGMATYNRQMRQASFNMNLFASKYFGQGFFPSSDNWTWDTYVESAARPLGKAFRWTVAGRTSYTTGTYNPSNLLKGTQLRLSAVPRLLDRQTTLTGSLSLGYTWGGNLASGNSVLSTFSANRRLTRDASLMVSYDYTRQPSFYRLGGRQRLNSSLFLGDRSRWYASIYSSLTLDAPYRTSTAYMNFKLGTLWRIGMRGMEQKFGRFTYNDLELNVSRQIGRREALLRWSTSRHRIELEMNAGTLGF
ncbi:MAG: hypothetical protein IT210_11445 [Armatimonadetes bacterium]|nr:hypothetical protein [Armatimonadota bacterium]